MHHIHFFQGEGRLRRFEYPHREVLVLDLWCWFWFCSSVLWTRRRQIFRPWKRLGELSWEHPNATAAGVSRHLHVLIGRLRCCLNKQNIRRMKKSPRNSKLWTNQFLPHHIFFLDIVDTCLSSKYKPTPTLSICYLSSIVRLSSRSQYRAIPLWASATSLGETSTTLVDNASRDPLLPL